LLTVSSKSLPCVMLVDPATSSIEPSIAWRASAVIPVRQIESVLALVGFHTGLQFAKDARASICATVRAVINNEHHRLETTNLSVSGVALRDFPHVAAGTPVKLELDLPFGTVSARAKVVRLGKEGRYNVAGLVFTELALPDRERIVKLVEGARRDAPAAHGKIEELFADIEVEDDHSSALCTEDIHRSQDLAEAGHLLDVHHELEALDRWAATDLWDRGVPDWLQAIGEDLTQIERVGMVRGSTVPEWVRPAIGMRICLARARHASKDGRLPSVLSTEGYAAFVRLADAATGCDADLVAQIAKIRSSLLRDLLATKRSVRAGAGAAPIPTKDAAPVAKIRARAIV
jgi:hypothetical protein